MAALLVGAPLWAQTQEPLSAIDWLRRNPPQGTSARPAIAEPPVSNAVVDHQITVSKLDAMPVASGLVPATVTGLPVTLWQGSETETLARLIETVPVRHNPAMQSLLYTVLLAEGLPPSDDETGQVLTLAQIDRLLAEGAVEPAEALARQAGPTRSPALFSRWFDMTLLTRTENSACVAMGGQPHLAPGYAARIFCSARRGDWPAAVLMLDSARLLGDLDEKEADLLDHFLHPDMAELLPPPPTTPTPSPLAFRLYEAIGEPLPTRRQGKAFSHLDLSDVSGWKAQVEAAERLARTGALGSNKFLGIYTENRPSASGGVWDRVAALQKFEAALNGGDPEQIGAQLRPAWDAMRAAGTETTFAELFAHRLAANPPSNPEAAQLAWQIRLLTDDFASVAADAPQDAHSQYLASIARGAPMGDPSGTGLRGAIAAGFAPQTRPPQNLQDLIAEGALGEAILRAIALFQQGTDGNPAALSKAIATFRALGLGDTARQATLQVMLLDPRR